MLDEADNAASTPADNWQDKLEAAIDEMNGRYFVVSLGGRSVIASLGFDDALGRERLVLSHEADIKLPFKNRHYLVGFTQKGHEIWKEFGAAWIEHPRRRTRQISLVPDRPLSAGVIKVQRGFAMEHRAGKWPMLHRHLYEVICSGNQEHLDWLLGWLAYCVQHPHRQAAVAVALRRFNGTGKGMVGQLLMRVFGNHALYITHTRHLVGNFNSHLTDTLFLFLDEAYWGGDKQGEGVLKAFIIERALMIEPKGIDAFPLTNRLKILMASNADWVVPASADERRYFILDVADCRRDDFEDFRQLHEAIEGDELGVLLHDLLARDLGGWKHRAAALNEHKLLDADRVTRYWQDCLTTGCVLGSGLGSEWPEDVVIEALRAAYVDHALDHGDRHPATITQMSARLRKLLQREAFLEAMCIDHDAWEWPDQEAGS